VVFVNACRPALSSRAFKIMRHLSKGDKFCLAHTSQILQNILVGEYDKETFRQGTKLDI
jgi:hypothetical protein